MTLIDKLLTDGHILPLKSKSWQSDKYTLSENGKIFLRDGGYVLEKENKDATKKLENEKLNFEYKLSKWKYKTYWFVFAFGIIGLIKTIEELSSVICQKLKEYKSESIIQNKEDTISISHQTKTDNPLTNTSKDTIFYKDSLRN